MIAIKYDAQNISFLVTVLFLYWHIPKNKPCKNGKLNKAGGIDLPLKSYFPFLPVANYEIKYSLENTQKSKGKKYER